MPSFPHLKRNQEAKYTLCIQRERDLICIFCFLCARIYLFLSLVDIVSYFEMKNINKSL